MIIGRSPAIAIAIIITAIVVWLTGCSAWYIDPQAVTVASDQVRICKNIPGATPEVMFLNYFEIDVKCTWEPPNKR